MAVALLAACGDPAGQATRAEEGAQPAASVPAPPTGPLTTVVEGGSQWAVLPAGAAVARAAPPVGFERRSEFLMSGADGAVRFVEKFVREADGRRAAIVDVHSVRATDALRDAISTPPAGYRATTVRGEPALISTSETGTVITLSWLEGGTMAVELYGVGDDVTGTFLHEVAETVRVVPLPGPRRLEVTS